MRAMGRHSGKVHFKGHFTALQKYDPSENRVYQYRKCTLCILYEHTYRKNIEGYLNKANGWEILLCQCMAFWSTVLMGKDC